MLSKSLGLVVGLLVVGSVVRGGTNTLLPRDRPLLDAVNCDCVLASDADPAIASEARLPMASAMFPTSSIDD